MITWPPAYLKLVLHLSITNVGGYLAINILGSFAGAFLNGWMADRFGRRRTFVVIACLQAMAVAIYTLAPLTLPVTLLLGFVPGTLQSGTAAGTGAYLAELFPDPDPRIGTRAMRQCRPRVRRRDASHRRRGQCKTWTWKRDGSVRVRVLPAGCDGGAVASGDSWQRPVRRHRQCAHGCGGS
ncbi:MFS transporter [Paraburkholderia sp. 32]|uniref:MFS transporter n=1 Tax=Paraburkholderia sp. 32 TaxID=2991057 RepID=UPI003D1BB144